MCNVHVHYDCLQTPQTIKTNHHIDELTLHESIVEDDSGEYYCDICERRRDLELWAYSCKETEPIFQVKLKPELEELDGEIEGARQEVDAMKANLEELTANLEQLKAKLKASTEKLEALKKKS
ncbi:uncharacterized protein LOC115690105 [Syzygium oleosum]|uniref:uncharacterized protein LOC115690105 n=1 Tax=Syzygium oleosum TaxID=219896 RepID=UPI0011D1C0D8|nr:uncharacterized protein LOC115690105 [Syzygium oleosum]